MIRLSAFDLASRLTGWCAGTGETVPATGAFEFPSFGEELGPLGFRFRQYLAIHFDRYDPEAVVYEAPILVVNNGPRREGRRTDDLLTIRKLYGMGFMLEAFCAERGVPCNEVDLRKIKKEVTGNAFAAKDDIVAVAKKCGVVLPPNKAQGMEDAADAWGAWLLGLRYYSKSISAEWDSLIWGRGRGALV